MKILKKLLFVLLATPIIFSCSTEDDNLIEYQNLELKKEEFINSKSYLLQNLNTDIISIFKSSIEFDANGNLSTFQYDVLHENLTEKEFKILLRELYRAENVDKIFYVNTDGEKEILFESEKNYPNKGRNRELVKEDVYLFNDKKNHRRGGCKPRSGWICEIRVNTSDIILVK